MSSKKVLKQIRIGHDGSVFVDVITQAFDDVDGSLIGERYDTKTISPIDSDKSSDYPIVDSLIKIVHTPDVIAAYQDQIQNFDPRAVQAVALESVFESKSAVIKSGAKI